MVVVKDASLYQVKVFLSQAKSPPGESCFGGIPKGISPSGVLIWYEVGPVSPDTWWQERHVELGSLPLKSDGPATPELNPPWELCME
jgi:hypothetical protein